MSEQLEMDLFAPSYWRHTVTNRSGKSRQIYAPNDALRAIHDRLLQLLRRSYVRPHHAHGSVRDRSRVTHANIHRGQTDFYIVDIYQAFPAIRKAWIVDLLAPIECELWSTRAELKAFVGEYVMEPRGIGLMTGMPSAPEIFNQILALRLDAQLVDLARRYGMRYSRYLDDMVFSGKSKITDGKAANIRGVIRDSGLAINFRKTHFAQIGTQPVVITGIRLTPVNGRLAQPTRSSLKRLSGLLHQFNQGADVSVEEIEGHMGFLRHIASSNNIAPNSTMKKLWRAYFEALPRLRPHAALTDLERSWQAAITPPQLTTWDPGDDTLF